MSIEIENLELKSQLCQMLGQIGALQQEVAAYRLKEVQQQKAALAQRVHDAAADSADRPSGAEPPKE